MANEEQRREIDEKLTTLVRTLFGGDSRAAFAHYDADGNGVIDEDELKALLKDAGVGSGLTRWAWAKGIGGEVDTGGAHRRSVSRRTSRYRVASARASASVATGPDIPPLHHWASMTWSRCHARSVPSS